MHKVATAFLLVICLLGHPFLMAHAGLPASHGDGALHAALHLEKAPHHHHHDGSFHQDDSDESVKHVYTDGWVNTADAVQAAVPACLRDMSAGVQRPILPAAREAPALEGPRHPPRLPA